MRHYTPETNAKSQSELLAAFCRTVKVPDQSRHHVSVSRFGTAFPSPAGGGAQQTNSGQSVALNSRVVLESAAESGLACRV